jgi:hypothetical protein
MKFNLTAALESLFRSLQSPKETDPPLPVSMILLLRDPRFPSLEQLRAAAEVAYGVPFSTDKTARYCVFQQVLFTLMNAGPHTLSFLYYTKPYGDNSEDFGRAMPMASQRDAWARHTSWMAIDYVKGALDLDVEYAVLAKFCAAILENNCTGIYLPRERTFIPNDGSLAPELERISSLCRIQFS